MSVELILPLYFSCFMGSKGGAVLRALASYPCGPGSTPVVDDICGLSLLLVLSLAPRGFSPGTPVFPSPQKFYLNAKYLPILDYSLVPRVTKFPAVPTYVIQTPP